MFKSKDQHFNRVKEFHHLMDGQTQEFPKEYDSETAVFRAGFKIEEIVEFVHASSQNESGFREGIERLHSELDKAAAKVEGKKEAKVSLHDQVDALLDLLYFTYGSFVLMGVDPEPIFQLVHEAIVK
ncbi:MAG: HAD family hydrolase [Streptococcus suis]